MSTLFTEYFFIYKGGFNISKYTAKTNKNEELVNENIRFKEVLLIDDAGEQVGVVSNQEALDMAINKNLDLVCVAPKANPPVCKIIDYGKYRFEIQKKAKEAKKNQKVQDTKEVRLSPVIDKHDIDTKLKNARKFIEKGDKVKVSMRFRGRQMAHTDIGLSVMKQFLEGIEDIVVVEKQPKLEGNNLFMFIAPKKK
ncbi:translation initiation factor IF-3 [Bacilli bacterium PM5-3]|nr:translation initiation factor IF-3 [Bacilli bacterium PM5-3]MDH6603437.1 translation initiation factor IF-3 [Bacilli bacterium PM5-9]